MLSTAQHWSWQSWRSALSKPNKSQATPTKHYKTLRNSIAIQSKSLTWYILVHIETLRNFTAIQSGLSKPNKSQATPTKHYKTLRNSTAILSKSLTWNTLKAVLAGQCCLIEFLASLLLLPEEPTKSQMSLCHIAQSANFQQLSRRHKMNVKHNPVNVIRYTKIEMWNTFSWS